jgi:hypothetical protein
MPKGHHSYFTTGSVSQGMKDNFQDETAFDDRLDKSDKNGFLKMYNFQQDLMVFDKRYREFILLRVVFPRE